MRQVSWLEDHRTDAAFPAFASGTVCAALPFHSDEFAQAYAPVSLLTPETGRTPCLMQLSCRLLQATACIIIQGADKFNTSKFNNQINPGQQRLDTPYAPCYTACESPPLKGTASMSSTEQILLAREAIGETTPLLSDCGALCGGACCRPDADGQGGVWLFPGEEVLLKGSDWCRIRPATPWPMLVCDGTCPRRDRPLGCRIFPLTPVRGQNGLWTVRMNARARPMCPLVRSGLKGLDPAFVRGVRSALRLIAASSEGEAFLSRWFDLEEACRAPLW